MQTAPTYAVIVAGGQGTRMGYAIPKQFLELDGKPILYHTIKAFRETIDDIQIILVLPEQQISMTQMVLQAFEERMDITIVAGGASRFHSVQNGLKDLPNDAIIFVHDGVRPLLSKELILRCYNQAIEKGSAIPALPATDSMRQVHGDKSTPLDRTNIRLMQTPQTFQASILLPSMKQTFQENFTDEATVVEAFGHEVHLCDGERNNIKITTPEDLIIAEALLKSY